MPANPIEREYRNLLKLGIQPDIAAKIASGEIDGAVARMFRANAREVLKYKHLRKEPTVAAPESTSSSLKTELFARMANSFVERKKLESTKHQTPITRKDMLDE